MWSPGPLWYVAEREQEGVPIGKHLREVLREHQGFRLSWADGTKSPALCTMTLFHSAPQLLRKFSKQGALYQSRKLQPLHHSCSCGVNQKLSRTWSAFNEMLTWDFFPAWGAGPFLSGSGEEGGTWNRLLLIPHPSTYKSEPRPHDLLFAFPSWWSSML